MGSVIVGEGAAFALQRLAREQMKHKLQADILTDLHICQIEGWPHAEYLHELHELVEGMCPCLKQHKRG